jgi:hypothetical protein
LKINPNGRIPALTDTFTDGQTINLFESGSIMEYLVDRYDKDHKISFPKGTRDWYAMKNWLYFQNAGVGPMQGQASKYHSFCAFHLRFAFSRQSRDHVDLSPAATTVCCRSCGGVVIQYRIWSGNNWLLLVVRRAQCGMILRYRQPG